MSLLISLLTFAFASVQPPAERIAPGACPFPDPTRTVKCGILTVPEDRSRPGGRTLSLQYAVVPASRPGPGMTPIFYFQGGPGQAAVEQATFYARSPLREHHDIVFLDQRGTAGDHRLQCPGPGDDADAGSWFESVYQAPYPERCRPILASKADLSQYTTAVAMRDVDALRRLLGYGKVNLLGGSYGSRAALIYMKMFGDSVRSSVQSGLVPLEARLPLFHPGGAQRALNRVFADCAADVACDAAFPDPAADFVAVRAALRAKPAPFVRPAMNGQPAATGRMTETRLLQALRPMLYATQTQRMIPLALRQARGGDFSLFGTAAVFARGANSSIASGMALSVTCSEDVVRIRPRDVVREARGAFLGERFIEERRQACAHWPKGNLPADHFKPFTRKFPVLLISGSFDPVTPKSMGDAYQRHFPNARHVVIPAGHSLPNQNPCLDGMIKSFFREPDPRRVDTSCVAAMPVPPFQLTTPQ